MVGCLCGAKFLTILLSKELEWSKENGGIDVKNNDVEGLRRTKFRQRCVEYLKIGAGDRLGYVNSSRESDGLCREQKALWSFAGAHIMFYLSQTVVGRAMNEALDEGIADGLSRSQWSSGSRYNIDVSPFSTRDHPVAL